jgi:hypothetical protein
MINSIIFASLFVQMEAFKRKQSHGLSQNFLFFLDLYKSETTPHWILNMFSNLTVLTHVNLHALSTY